MPNRAPVTPREWGLALLLVIVGGLAWWWQQGTAPEPARTEAGARQPDFVVDGLRAVTMAADGQPLRRLVSTQVRHYPDDDSTELDAPVLLLYATGDDDPTDDDAASPPWRVRADTGWVSADGDELLLQGAVAINRVASATAPPVRLTSAELLVLPDFEYAETARFARLRAGEDWVTAADGMQVWFGSRMRAKLFGRVHARLTMAAPQTGPDSGAGTGPDIRSATAAAADMLPGEAL